MLAATVITLVCLGIFQALRWHRDRRAAREEVRLRSLSIAEPRTGPISVRGTWHHEGETTWLECARERVELRGPVHVVRGTVTRSTWRVREPAHALRDGDEVVALGSMQRLAASAAEDANYRISAGGWALAPPAGCTQIEICALRPATCPRALGPWRGGLVLASSVGLALGLVRLNRAPSAMMPAIPGASVERWTQALAAVCDDVRVDPKKDIDTPIAKTTLPVHCALKPEWTRYSQDAGSFIQLDDADRPNRMDFEAIVTMDKALRLARRLLLAYGLPPDLVQAARGGDAEPSFTTGGLSVWIYIAPSASYVGLSVTIRHQ